MSKEIQTLDQKEVEVGENTYLVQAFPATFGLKVMDEMTSGDGFSVERMVDIIKRSVTFKGKLFDDKSFNVHFSRKYNDIAQLFQEILSFNFGEAEDEEAPLEQSPEQGDM